MCVCAYKVLAPLFLLDSLNEDGTSFAPKRLKNWIHKGFVVKDLSIVFVKDLSIVFGSVD